MRLRKSLCSLLLLVCLAAALWLPCAAASPVYTDVSPNSWAADYIARATQLGIFQGEGNGRFAPKDTMSRAAFVTALCRLFGWESETGKSGSFRDVPAGKWYTAAVETAYAHGAVTLQTPDFRPGDPITREEMAAMLVRALGYSTLAGLAVEYETPFTDLRTNRGYITVAYDLGIFTGTSATTFSPGSSATREQVAAVLMRLYDKMHSSFSVLDASQLPAGQEVLTVESRREGGAFPSASAAPLEELYKLLRENAGTSLPLVLSAQATRWISDGQSYRYAGTLTQQQLEQWLSDPGSQVYRSTRWESSYLVNGATVVWFESPEDLQAKAELAQLLGVSRLYVSRPDGSR